MWEVARTTAALAAVTTLLLIPLAAPLAWWLARVGRRGSGWGKDVVAALASLPLVLPPTVLGFYLLIALGPRSPLMAPLHLFGVRTLAFTFTGLVVGSLFYSLPFAVQPLRAAFEGIGREPAEAARTLGASPLTSLVRIELPLARRGVLAAAILVFAHTVGEFGVVLMIGGGVPGKTEVASIRIYQLVEALDFGPAHALAAGLAGVAFLALLTLMLVDRRFARLAG